ncbi:hypothetical protein TWF569_006982 [Orbilia oligospora]|uniref:Thioredoxin domain-containing protein n=2 Tax=Orbilia oligospora TaxID=2813651 RepID=A0A7C8JRR2_ORBOL|nr:hypothetical protein TWF102_011920 [Orbilia oligospora]KAF3110117.1 hypothetical protein TWF706_000855 [Orbilia oligospora]KAF3117589.1 hypothetical protein TWF103_006314 [Orbilia oligospora]KAF3128600.1 hypothetical protein TWF703_009350 [Orbilia oligospora]KAF3144783.1 hypothetical protein TWF569_006982 [Orbilia oligospora]
MKPSTLLLPLLTTLVPTPVNAQWEQIQEALGLGGGSKTPREPVVPVPNVVLPIDKGNFRELLGGNDLEWLVLFTTGTENCPGCILYENTFNEAVALLHDNNKIHFGKVDCDTDAVVCSLFSAWGSRVFHVSHSTPPSASLPGLADHLTHLHPVPFHRPGTESQPIPTDSEGKPIKDARPPPPPPDAKWIAEVVNEEKWREFEEWTGWTHPLDGVFQVPIYQFWWVVSIFAKVPPMAMMVGIGLLSRFVTARFTGRTLARREQQRETVQQAAKKKN